MKTYPTITYDVIRMNGYAFDKLDGSNIRGEWASKKYFWKFGTRKRLLDRNEEPLGEAVDLIKSKYEKDLSDIFKKNKIGRAICFFEFWGENSFAGNHEDEPHTTTLIDANPFKQGILPPAKYLKLFGHLDIAKVLYTGKINKSFIEAVRNQKVDGMTFEGVVFKGIHKNLLRMFKVKSKAWITKVKEYYYDNPVMMDDLLDKTERTFSTAYRQRRFCSKCFRNGSLAEICLCGGTTRKMDYDAQPPRKSASKMRWKDFFKEWYPQLNFQFLWKNRF